MPTQPASQPRFLRLPDVLDRTGLGKTKVYAMVKEGSFPAPKKVGRASLWPESAVDAWFAAAAA